MKCQVSEVDEYKNPQTLQTKKNKNINQTNHEFKLVFEPTGLRMRVTLNTLAKFYK